MAAHFCVPSPSLYPVLGTETELLLGTRFVLLRREFLDWVDWERPQPRRARKIVVTLGGGDSSTALVKVIEGLRRLNLDDLDVKIVCGQLNQNRDMLVQAAEPASFRIELMTATDEMPELMAWADLAIPEEEARAGSWRSWGCLRWPSCWRTTSWESSKNSTAGALSWDSVDPADSRWMRSRARSIGSWTIERVGRRCLVWAVSSSMARRKSCRVQNSV